MFFRVFSENNEAAAYKNLEVFKMKVKEGFVLRKIAGSNIVVPIGAASLDFNGMITLNESAAFLWKKIEQGAEVEDLVAALLAEYEVDEETARKCTVDFVAKLNEAGCVE